MIVVITGVLCVAGYYVVRAAYVVSFDPEKLYQVVYVTDGDTFKAKIWSHVVTVRMLGINTPETVDPRKQPECYGKEASDQTKELLSSRQVRLKLNPNREEKDKYGRYLAYVYRDDGMFVNETLLKNGFAREYTYGKAYDFQKEFRELETEAKGAKMGLWGACTTAREHTDKYPR